MLLLQARFPRALLCCRLLSWSPPREGSAHCAASQQGLECDPGPTQNSLTLFPQLSSTPGWTGQVRGALGTGRRGGPAGQRVGALRPSVPGHRCARRPPSAPSQVGRLPLSVGGGQLRTQSPAMLSSPFVTGASCDRPLERGSFSLLTMLVLLSVSNLIAFHSSSLAFHAELLCHARGGWALRRRVGDRLSPQVTAEVPCCVEKGTERESRRVCRRPEPAPGPGCLTAS